MTDRNDALVLGVDASTTACKAVAWDRAGRAVSEARAPIALDNPEPDAWQQDADQWWRATLEAVGGAVRALGPDGAERVRALSIAHQRETFVVTDAQGRPLHPALAWMDARCGAQVRQLGLRCGAERLHELSGKPPCVTPSIYKLAYLREREPDLFRKKPRLCDVHAFVAWRLSGRFATSLPSADPLGLVDLGARDWSDELLALVGLDRSQVPELCEPGSVLGRLEADAAARTGLPAGLPIVAGAGDGQAAGLGAGIREPGRAYVNLGTAVVSGVLARAPRFDRAFRTLIAASPGDYFLETDLKGGTFTLDWLAKKWLPSSTSLDALEREADALGPGADGLVLVPYWNGVMNPYWDDDARGVVLGWHGAHGPAHVYRAVLEGIALEERLCTLGVEHATGTPIAELVVMGGGSRSDLFCQILADVTDKPVVRAGSSEATALGAGILASVAAGLHPSLDSAVRAMTRTAERFTPSENAPWYRALYDEVYADLYPELRERLQRLARLRKQALSAFKAR